MFEFFHYLETVDSTNEYLKQFLPQRRPGAVMAKGQTSGKGSHGRHWDSPPGKGLYVSFLLFPDWPLERAHWLNRIATLAVVRSLAGWESTAALRLRIKPPNDVLTGGRKLSGALVELSTLEGRVLWAIVGIGVNLSQERFQLMEDRTPPTSLLREGLEPPAPHQLCAILAEQFARLYQDLETGGEASLAAEFEAALTPAPGETPGQPESTAGEKER